MIMSSWPLGTQFSYLLESVFDFSANSEGSPKKRLQKHRSFIAHILAALSAGCEIPPSRASTVQQKGWAWILPCCSNSPMAARRPTRTGEAGMLAHLYTAFRKTSRTTLGESQGTR